MNPLDPGREEAAPETRIEVPADPQLTPCAANTTTGTSDPLADESLTDPTHWPDVPGYAIEGVLGRGGMGIVFRARDGQQAVAIKMLRAEQANAEERGRFRREMAAVGRLDHANLVKLIGAGEAQGRPYCVFELLEGGSLDRHINGKPQPPRQAARLLELVARAVHHAHQANIVHRDLKPSNILLTGDGTPKVSDFGLARSLESDGQSLYTPSGMILGTPSYMAPEQAAGKRREVGPAADVYALGAILYELLTGQTPFQGNTIVEVLQKVQLEEPVSPRQRVHSLPRDLDTICLKCLHKEPGRRYESAEALADELARFLHHEPIRARPTPRWERALKWTRRHPIGTTLLAVFALLLLAGAGAGWWYWDAHQRVKVDYFANLVRRRGVPEGIGHLTAEDVSRRAVSYKLARRGGRVEHIEAVNGHGRPASDHPLQALLSRPASPQTPRREVVSEYRRNEKGELIEEVARDQTGEVVWTLHYPKPATGNFTDQNGFPRPRTGSGAAFVSFEFSEEGWEQEVRYLDRDQRPQPNSDGNFGEHRSFDERGLMQETVNLGFNGQPTPHHTQGWTRMRAKYDAQGNRLELAYFGRDNRPALHADGYAIVRWEYDSWGNERETTYWDVEGKPALHKDGNHGYRLKRNEAGDITEWTYFDRQSQPTLLSQGYARLSAKYDERGNRVEEACHGSDGTPALFLNGFWKWTAKFDERGQRLEERYFDRVDRPARHKEGYHRVTYRYDDRGRRLEESYLDTNDAPVLNSLGFARASWEYDARGNNAGWAFWGLDGKLTLRKEGFARGERVFDERGNVLEELYFLADGKPALHVEGYFKRTAVFDHRGQQTEGAYFAPDGRPVLVKDGYARWTAAYVCRAKL